MRNAARFTLALAAVMSSVTTASIAQSVLTHHVRDSVITGDALYVERMNPVEVLQLDLVLPLRDAAGLKQFLANVYNPKSSVYHQFLTPAEFTERFGPTQQDYETVLQFAKNYGLEVVSGSRDRMEVQVKGSVWLRIETAFHVSMSSYLHPTEDRIFYSADREPTADLPFNLWHISGLNNFSVPHPLYSKRSEVAAARGIDAEALVSHATTGSGPSASFLGSDMRAAYYGGTALTGAGQNLGLFEFEGTDLADVTTYYKNVKQTNSVPITLLSTDGTSTKVCVDSRAGGRCDDIAEQTLDITQAAGAWLRGWQVLLCTSGPLTRRSFLP